MIELKNISKTFRTSDSTVEALKNVSITVNDGDIFGIIGMSGAGKSTLVRCINMLERPDEGAVLIDGVDVGSLKSKDLRNTRREVTMIFQGFNLLMQRSCLNNVMFPLELAGVKKADAKKRALELLETVGLPDKANAYPAQLSGGQQQRIAIARALATDPKVLLCDEATSALDPKTSHAILSLIREINEKLGITVIIITHQMSVIEEVCNNVAILDHGEVAEQGRVVDIFTHPKSQAAKRLVFPEGEQEILVENSAYRLRVIFGGAKAAGTPLIARLAKEKGIEANILGASTKAVGDKAYGNMLLSFADEESKDQAIAFFQRLAGSGRYRQDRGAARHMGNLVCHADIHPDCAHDRSAVGRTACSRRQGRYHSLARAAQAFSEYPDQPAPFGTISDPDRRSRAVNKADYRQGVWYGCVHRTVGYRGVSVYRASGREFCPRGQPEYHRDGAEHRRVALPDHHQSANPRERPEPDFEHHHRPDNHPRLYRYERRDRRRRSGQACHQLRLLPLQIPRDDHYRYPADPARTAVPVDRYKAVGSLG